MNTLKCDSQLIYFHPEQDFKEDWIKIVKLNGNSKSNERIALEISCNNFDGLQTFLSKKTKTFSTLNWANLQL